MKLKDFLKEEWFKTVKNVDGDIFEIFVNPTKKELTDLYKDEISYVRFLIDMKEEKVYVWDGDLLHEDVSRKIKKPYKLGGVKGYIWGDGRIVKSKIKFSAFSGARIVSSDAKEVSNTDWLKKYFINL
jgi:hypothetical protein